VTALWPEAKSEIARGQQQRENYRDLFRALLRLQKRYIALQQSGSVDSAWDQIFSSALPPESLAMAGILPVSEAAVEAYVDMACFIFEKKHPGKSVDAEDNRAVFARVIADKYADAPSDADREAMAAFDLSWAKFKILWDGASEEERATLMNDGSLRSPKVPSKALEKALEQGPWKDAVKRLDSLKKLKQAKPAASSAQD